MKVLYVNFPKRMTQLGISLASLISFSHPAETIIPPIKYERTADNHSMISCAHINSAVADRKILLQEIQKMYRAYSENDTLNNKYRHDSDLNALLDSLGFRFDKIALNPVLLAKWKIHLPKFAGSPQPDAFALFRPGSFDLTDLAYKFENQNLNLQIIDNQIEITAPVRPFDICLTDKIELWALYDCPIETYEFSVCPTPESCLKQKEVIYWQECRQIKFSLGTSELEPALTQKPKKIGSNNPRGEVI